MGTRYYTNIDYQSININERRSKLMMDYLNGSNINEYDDLGNTLLMYNAIVESKEDIEYNIKLGADVNMINNNGRTALSLACEMTDDLEIIKLLIVDKTLINTRDVKGMTALSYVKLLPKQKKNIIKYLEQMGAK